MAKDTCPVCEGTGWVLDKVEGGARARRCECHRERRLKALRRQAAIPRRYLNCTFGNFEDHDRENHSQRDALRIARRFVQDYPVQDVGLLFIGPCGVGKTHLAVAVIQELIQTKRASCRFYDFRELIRDIQSTFTPDSPLTESDILQPVFNCEVLVLDELGAQRSSAWVDETIFFIINSRYNNRKLTIFTSNYPDSGEKEDPRTPWFKKEGDSLVDRIGVRLRSRIYEMCKVVEMTGPDYRKIAKQGSYRF
jgi:DNA replication protein DnaC